jgi:DNA-binding response OmpR family regulator
MSDNAIEVVIHRLRAKARAWNMKIRTYRGAGYALEPA